MNKSNFPFIFLVLFLALFRLNGCMAKEFETPSNYLVDSLDLSDFTSQDLELNEMCLREYHATDDDTIKMPAFYFLSSTLNTKKGDSKMILYSKSTQQRTCHIINFPLRFEDIYSPMI